VVTAPARRTANAVLLFFALALAWAGPIDAAEAEALGPPGTRWATVRAEPGVVDLRRTVAIGDRAIRRTHVLIRTQGSGGLLQRNADGFYVPWDGDRSTLADAGFRPVDGRLTFKILAEPITGLSLPLTVVVMAETPDGLITAEFQLERN
jgi:hypothetical protein